MYKENINNIDNKPKYIYNNQSREVNMMKKNIFELKENEPLKIINVSWCGKLSSNEVLQDERIKMQVFTDGVVEKEEKTILTSIDNYKIKEKDYKYSVNTLKTKEIYLKDYNYIVAFLIAKEDCVVGNISGWFFVIKDITIYLKDLNDKRALKNAKQVIKDLYKLNSQQDYSSILTTINNQMVSGLSHFELDNINKNILTLSRRTK